MERNDGLDEGEQWIDDDMPCVKCGYNLRGLADEGKCPECGAAVGETLDFVLARVLCPACMAPNHPSASICGQCKSPISGVAAMANYYRPTFVVSRKVQAEREEGPEPPSRAAMMVGWVAGVVLLGSVMTKVVAEALSAPGDLASGGMTAQSWAMLVMAGVLVLVFLAIIYVPTRGYHRQRKHYVLDLAAFQAKKQSAAPAREE